MFEIRAFLYLQFPDDTVCKHLSQFDAPLVAGVDVPYAALGEDLVLVEGDELAQDVWGELWRENGVRGPVSLKYTVWHLEAWETHDECAGCGYHGIDSAWRCSYPT